MDRDGGADSGPGSTPTGGRDGGDGGLGVSQPLDGGHGVDSASIPGSAPDATALPGSDAGAAGSCRPDRRALERQPAEVLLLLDKSGSMLTSFDAGTRWDGVASALRTVVPLNPTAIFWGLKVFPAFESRSCGLADGVDVEPTATAHDTVVSKVAATQPEPASGTPAREAVLKVTAYLKARATKNPKYLLLVTDSTATCPVGSSNGAADDNPGAVAAVTDAALAGFPTFVVGIDPTGFKHPYYTELAEKGGLAQGGPTAYYAASNPGQLTSALEAIAGTLASCTFSLDESPPSPNDVAVEVKGQRVPRDATDGWSYGPNMRSVVLHGSWCENAKREGTNDVNIVLGCPGMPAP